MERDLKFRLKSDRKGMLLNENVIQNKKMVFSMRFSRQKKFLFIFIIIFTIFFIFSNIPNTIRGYVIICKIIHILINLLNFIQISSLKTSMISPPDSSVNSSQVLPLITQISDNSSKIKYLVNTEKCKIIDWPLFDSETRPLFHNNSGKKIKCYSSGSRILSVRRINQTVIEIKNLRDTQPYPQCYATNLMRRKGFDSKVFFGKTIGPIKGTVNIPDCDAVTVRCYQTRKKLSKVSKNVKYVKINILKQIVPLIPEKKFKNFKTNEQNIPNVLMLGIDSISWLQFKRQFSLTKSLAQKYEFYPMYGYNKVGDNTFPNLMAVLTGQFSNYYWNESIRNAKHFDDVPFIWKEFSKQNFTTTLIEDLPRYSLFNFNKIGFVEQPTDYYLRPVSLSIDKQLRRFCYKDQMEIQVKSNLNDNN